MSCKLTLPSKRTHGVSSSPRSITEGKNNNLGLARGEHSSAWTTISDQADHHGNVNTSPPPPPPQRTLILSQQRPAWPEQKAKITHYVKQVKLPIETSSHSMAWLPLCNCLWNFVYTQRPSLHRLVLGRWQDHLRVGGRDMGMKLVLNPACRAWAEDIRGWLARTESANSVE